MPRSLFVGFLTLALFGNPQSGSKQRDSYDVLLHSPSLADQRVALTMILHDPQKYVLRIQQSLREYPRLLRADSVAANRAVYLAALVRDPSFSPILVQILGDAAVLDECEYECPVVFDLTIQACFAGWSPPSNLDSRLMTVYDLQKAIQRVPRMSLKIGSIEDVVQGPGLEEHRKEIERKTEEELISMAGPDTPSIDTRLFAAYRLKTLVSGSKNRIDLYVLAMNDIRDGSGEYRSAIYASIYRSELARARNQ